MVKALLWLQEEGHNMLQLFMAISPILIVMIGIVGLKKPATIVSAIALIYTIFVTMFYGNFKLENDVLFSETTKGIIEGAKMVFMIWSAFLILNMLINTGAMDKIKEIIANLTLDKRKQFIIIAFCFGEFLEGVAGSGTPAAIAAPFLVALGIPPVFAIIGALAFNGIAASLGAAGLTTIGFRSVSGCCRCDGYFEIYLLHPFLWCIVGAYSGTCYFVGEKGTGKRNCKVCTFPTVSLWYWLPHSLERNSLQFAQALDLWLLPLYTSKFSVRMKVFLRNTSMLLTNPKARARCLHGKLCLLMLFCS